MTAIRQRSARGHQYANRLSVGTKLAYGSGVFLDQVGLHAANRLAFPVYNVLLGVNPALIGYALAVFRLWDAITDPVMGFITDRWSGRWGRRKPFMIVGAALCAVLFPLLYTVSPSWSQWQALAYFVAIGLLYFTALTIYAIPYAALGLELAKDYDDRTSLYSIRGIFLMLGFMGLSWIYPLAQNDIFGSAIEGVRWIALATGVLLSLAALVPVFLLKERFGRVTSPDDSRFRLREFFTTFRCVLKNGAFRRLVGLQVAYVIGWHVVGALGFYLSVYYLYSGDSKAAAPLLLVGGTVEAVASVAALIMLPRVAPRFEKVQVLAVFVGVNLLGSACKWFCYTPAFPWLSLLPVALLAIGNIGFWTLMPSMTADICDLEEAATGRRMEGAYYSVTQWLNKLGYTLATALSGSVLVWIGFDADRGGMQTASALHWLRLAYLAVPAAAFVVCLYLLRGVCLSREKLQCVREMLEESRLG